MDPRSAPQQSSAKQNTRDGPSNPIPPPPPPFTLQVPMRQSQPTLANDPFLPRRGERDDPSQGPVNPPSQNPLGIRKYSAALPREVLGTAIVMTDGPQMSREKSGSWRPGDGRTNGHELQDARVSAGTLPPPPTSSSLPTTLQDLLSQRDHLARQQSLGLGSPRMYGAAQEHPPPPPPPFSGRPMLPPSPQYHPPASMSRVPPPPPPPPPPFPAARELPASSSVTRPESSMSISSMLDSAPSRPARESGIATKMNGTSPTGSYSSVGAQIPPASSPTRSVNGNIFPGRRSPDRQQNSQPLLNRPFRAYSGGAPPRSYAVTKSSSSETSRFGPSSATAVSQYSPRSDTGIQQEWKVQPNRNSSVPRVMDRPNSQPNGYRNSTINRSTRRTDMDVQLIENAKREENAIKEASLRQANRDGVSSFDFLGRRAQLERQQHLEQEKRSTSHSSPREDRLSGMNYPFLTQSSVFSEPSISVVRPDKGSVIDRLLDNSYQANANVPKGPTPDDSFRRLGEDRQRLPQYTPKYSPTVSRHSLTGNVDERPDQTRTHNMTPGTQEAKPRIDAAGQQVRNVDDGTQNHRGMLALLNENGKRAGRVSPLPQAVQGAQSQKRGPSSDPSIKNEFSRMFAGIGSGVGSTGLNSGASTPFPPSPKQNTETDQGNPSTGRNDLLEFAKSRNGLRAGKRSKRVKEDDSKDLETKRDQTPTGSTGMRGIRKSRHGQTHHHHPNHRHHHHYLEDQNGTSVQQAGNTIAPASHHHLHHHHRPDGSIHFHPPSKPVHHKAPRATSTKINNDAILESIRDLPRHHLGSILYSPSPESSKSPASYDLHPAYAPSPYTIPSYQGKENCTLIVRIPRFCLSKEEREQVCLSRAVWGADVYSDDSDPLAAAIHAGWIRGEWGDDVDFSMLEVNTELEVDPKQTTFKSVPKAPMLPTPGKDLHLTLLILPTLQKYTSRVAHGIKSRPWGGDHDGVSFKIEEMTWVDEQAGRGESRDGESRRKRLRMMTAARFTGPALRLGMGKGLGQRRAEAAAA